MDDYILSAESIIDLSQDYVDELGISIINSNYEINGNTYLDDFGQTLDMKEFYESMREGASTSTSRINTSEYLDYFRPLADTGKDIIHVCLSTGMSGQYKSLLEAFETLKEEYPDTKFYPVDALMASTGVGLLMAKLSKLKNEGMDIDELYKWTEENKRHVITYTSNEDLHYVARGGRISKTAANIGGMLHICPLIEIDNEGHLVVTDKIRTRKKLLNSIIEHIENNAYDGLEYSDQIFIGHCDNMELVDELRDRIEDKFKNIDGDIKVFNIGPTIGAHIGPGTIAVFFWGKERMSGYKK